MTEMHQWIMWSGILVVCYFTWMPFVYVLRRYSRSGSHRRFVWNTLEKIFRGPAACFMAWPLLQLQVLSGPHSAGLWVGSFFSTFLCAGIYYRCWRMVREDDRDDDDDWFNQTKRRITRWLRSTKIPQRQLVKST